MNTSPLSVSPYRSCEVPLTTDFGQGGESLPFVVTSQSFGAKIVKYLKEQFKTNRNNASSIVKVSGGQEQVPSIGASLELREVIVCDPKPVPSGGSSLKSCVGPKDKTTAFIVIALIIVMALLLLIACSFLPWKI
jgi:hypothetical protein